MPTTLAHGDMRKVTLFKLCSTLLYHIVKGKLKQKRERTAPSPQSPIDRITRGTSALFNLERRIDPLVESKYPAPFPRNPQFLSVRTPNTGDRFRNVTLSGEIDGVLLLYLNSFHVSPKRFKSPHSENPNYVVSPRSYSHASSNRRNVTTLFFKQSP